MRTYEEVTFNSKKGSHVEPIKEAVLTEYKDGRKVSILKTESNSYVITIENPNSENHTQKLSLLEDSYLALIQAIAIYIGSDTEKTDDRIQDMLERNPLIESKVNDNLIKK